MLCQCVEFNACILTQQCWLCWQTLHASFDSNSGQWQRILAHLYFFHFFTKLFKCINVFLLLPQRQNISMQSRVAERKLAGPIITQRAMDRNHPLLMYIFCILSHNLLFMQDKELTGTNTGQLYLLRVINRVFTLLIPFKFFMFFLL